MHPFLPPPPPTPKKTTTGGYSNPIRRKSEKLFFQKTIQLSSDFKKLFFLTLCLQNYRYVLLYYVRFGTLQSSMARTARLFSLIWPIALLFTTLVITVHISEKPLSKQLCFVRNIYENRLIDFCFQLLRKRKLQGQNN